MRMFMTLRTAWRKVEVPADEDSSDGEVPASATAASATMWRRRRGVSLSALQFVVNIEELNRSPSLYLCVGESLCYKECHDNKLHSLVSDLH